MKITIKGNDIYYTKTSTERSTLCNKCEYEKCEVEHDGYNCAKDIGANAYWKESPISTFAAIVLIAGIIIVITISLLP